jgi:hypothetical protein
MIPASCPLPCAVRQRMGEGMYFWDWFSTDMPALTGLGLSGYGSNNGTERCWVRFRFAAICPTFVKMRGGAQTQEEKQEVERHSSRLF